MKFRELVDRMRGSEPTDSLESRHLPLMVTPLETDSDEHIRKFSTHESSVNSNAADEPSFKPHHEASTIELFYDLFFVANLATFTVNHEITSGSTFRSYIGFFSLLWATWLQTSLFDVRFAYDSVFQRVCKAVHFGVQIGFVISGAVYSTDPAYADKSAYQTLAIVQMVSRLVLVIQYASVLWYVRPYPRTVVPLLLIMGTLFAASMVYLGTYFGFNLVSSKTYYAWYITAPIEIVICVVISSVWRVLSFRHTHLIERVGLLTLIIIGEGIIGLSKSVSYLLQFSSTVSGRDIGVLIASVLLIYFIWMLYFDQIQNNRFGTIKQQVWALLHYPLHLCILFTVEGSTNLYVWDIIVPLYRFWDSLFPRVPAGSTFLEAYPDSTVLVDTVNAALETLSTRFKEEGQVYKYYDYNKNITTLENLASNYTYASQEYLHNVDDVLFQLWAGVGNAIFEIFGVYPPEVSAPPPFSPQAVGPNIKNPSPELVDTINEFYSLTHVYDVVFMYFYIAAGVFLVVLSVLYMIGNKRKTKSEWLGIVIRIVMGTGITMLLVGLSTTIDRSSTINFIQGPWHVIFVMLVYFIVIVVDNVLIERAIHQRRRKQGTVDVEKPQSRLPHPTSNVNYQYTRANDSEETAYQPTHAL